MFCNAYSGCFKSYDKIKYITDADMSKFVSQKYGCPFLKEITVGSDPVGKWKTGAALNTAASYLIQNVGSGLTLNAAATATQSAAKQVWKLQDAGEGYYFLCSTDGSCLTLAAENAENGTALGLAAAAQSDAQRLKFVGNGDGTYTITTKAGMDQSCLGIAAGSKEAGAAVVQWACDESDNQKWTIGMQGKLIENLRILDTENTADWSLRADAQTGDPVFGDREVTYATLPAALVGAEAILTACDAKSLTTDLATFTAGADCTVYVALDSRVTTLPAWLGTWTKTDLTATGSTSVTFVLYSRQAAAGEIISLGANGQSSGCVGYTVFAKENGATNGDVNQDGSIGIADVVLLQKYLLCRTTLTQAQAADMNADGVLNVQDLSVLKRLLLK